MSLNGFDTTNLKDNEGFPDSAEPLQKFESSSEEKTIKAMYFNVERNIYEEFQSFLFRVQDETLVITFKETIKFTQVTKEIIANFLYYAGKIKVNSVCILLGRKNKEYGKFFEFLFKTSQNFTRTNDCRI